MRRPQHRREEVSRHRHSKEPTGPKPNEKGILISCGHRRTPRNLLIATVGIFTITGLYRLNRVNAMDRDSTDERRAIYSLTPHPRRLWFSVIAEANPNSRF